MSSRSGSAVRRCAIHAAWRAGSSCRRRAATHETLDPSGRKPAARVGGLGCRIAALLRVNRWIPAPRYSRNHVAVGNELLVGREVAQRRPLRSEFERRRPVSVCGAGLVVEGVVAVRRLVDQHLVAALLDTVQQRLGRRRRCREQFALTRTGIGGLLQQQRLSLELELAVGVIVTERHLIANRVPLLRIGLAKRVRHGRLHREFESAAAASEQQFLGVGRALGQGVIQPIRHDVTQEPDDIQERRLAGCVRADQYVERVHRTVHVPQTAEIERLDACDHGFRWPRRSAALI